MDFELPNFLESAGLKMGSRVAPWITQGLTPEKAANLAKMTVSQAFDKARLEGYNRNFVPSAGQKAVSGTRYTLQGIGSLLGQNRVPFGAPFNTNVGGGASDLQKLIQNPTVSSIVNNPILKTVARGAGALGTLGMASGAYDFGNWAGNSAIDTQFADNIGLGRNDIYEYGGNFANTNLGKNIFNVGSNIANWFDDSTNTPDIAVDRRGRPKINPHLQQNNNVFSKGHIDATEQLASNRVAHSKALAKAKAQEEAKAQAKARAVAQMGSGLTGLNPMHTSGPTTVIKKAPVPTNIWNTVPATHAAVVNAGGDFGGGGGSDFGGGSSGGGFSDGNIWI
jgi:hypothetical protein